MSEIDKFRVSEARKAERQRIKWEKKEVENVEDPLPPLSSEHFTPPPPILPASPPPLRPIGVEPAPKPFWLTRESIRSRPGGNAERLTDEQIDQAILKSLIQDGQLFRANPMSPEAAAYLEHLRELAAQEGSSRVEP